MRLHWLKLLEMFVNGLPTNSFVGLLMMKIIAEWRRASKSNMMKNTKQLDRSFKWQNYLLALAHSRSWVDRFHSFTRFRGELVAKTQLSTRWDASAVKLQKIDEYKVFMMLWKLWWWRRWTNCSFCSSQDYDETRNKRKLWNLCITFEIFSNNAMAIVQRKTFFTVRIHDDKFLYSLPC